MLLFLVGCQAAATPGDGCVRASDCPSGLVCAIGRCRDGCRTSDDCGPSARCIVDPTTMVRSCSLSVDSCATHDCALGFVCRDDQCLNACGSLVGCPDRACEDGACVPLHGDSGVAPLDASVPMGVVHIAAGNRGFCATTGAGALWCWGDATAGALGDGLEMHGDCDTCASTPQQALRSPGHPLTGVTLSATQTGFTCAVVAGIVECWGNGPLGSVGAFTSLTPVQAQVSYMGEIGPIDATTMITAGTDHLCAVWGQSQTVSCWGEGPNGQLGDGAATPRTDFAITASQFASMPLAISASQHHTIVLDGSGKMHGVGINSALELGTTLPTDATTATSPDFPAARLMVTNGAHTCFVGAGDGALHCLGGDYLAVLGAPPIPDLTSCDVGMCTATPSTLNVPNGETIMALGLTDADACVATSSGAVFCVGEGAIMSTDSTTLLQVTTLTDVMALAGSDDAMCALTHGGQVLCWGSNDHGQLGRGTHDDGAFPTPVAVTIPE